MSLIQKEEQSSTLESSKSTTPATLPEWFDPKEAEAAAEALCKEHNISFVGAFFPFWFANDQKPRQGVTHGMLMLEDKSLRHVRTIAEAVKIGRMFGFSGVYEYPADKMADIAFSWIYINKKKKED